MSETACKLVYRSKAEHLWIWDYKNRKWSYNVDAVSGGGRGQKIPGLKKQTGYGADNARENTGRISNMGGVLPTSLAKLGKPDPTNFGVIPNGIYEVGPVYTHKTLKRCARLTMHKGSAMGRDGFHIHGQGKHGSEGCIVPINGKLEFVLGQIAILRHEGRLFLRVEQSTVMDIPEHFPTNYA